MNSKVTWRLLKDGITDPYMHFAVEESVLRATDECIQPPTLRIRRTVPSVWIGYYQLPEEDVDLAFCEENGIPVVRRMNSGGAVYQDEGTFCYSAFFRKEDLLQSYGLEDTDDLYRVFGQIIISLCRDMGISAELSSVNDITAGGRKIYGSAQMEWYKAFVHSGSILFNVDKERMQRVLRPSVLKFADKRFKNVKERVANLSELSALNLTIESVMDLFTDKFAEILKVELREGMLTENEQREAQKLFSDKYSRKEWTFRRAPDRTTMVSVKTPGGVLTLRCGMSEGVINSLHITGDFLVSQPEEIEGLCAALKGHNLPEAIEKVKEFRKVPFYLREGLINLLAELGENQ